MIPEQNIRSRLAEVIPERNIRSRIKDAGHAGVIPERNIRSRRCYLSGITTFWSGYSALGSPLQAQRPLFWSGYSAPGLLRAKKIQTPDQENLDPGGHENLDLGSRLQKTCLQGVSNCLSVISFAHFRLRAPRSARKKPLGRASPPLIPPMMDCRGDPRPPKRLLLLLGLSEGGPTFTCSGSLVGAFLGGQSKNDQFRARRRRKVVGVTECRQIGGGGGGLRTMHYRTA